MSVAAEKLAGVLAIPVQDRAFLAHELIAILENVVDMDAKARWRDNINRRSREIEKDRVNCRPVAETVQNIRAKLHARREPS